MTSVLRVQNLTVSYNGKLALDGVSFAVEAGERVAIVGPNGAGKSTLFKALLGLSPTQGRHRGDEQGRVRLRGTTVNRGLELPGDGVRRGPDGPNRQNRVASLAASFGSGDRQAMPGPGRHAGVCRPTDRRTVWRATTAGFIARALAQEATILLMDEPFSGVDTPSQEAILEILDRPA